jgi:hypothetical protein
MLLILLKLNGLLLFNQNLVIRSDDAENELLDDSNDADVTVLDLNPNRYVCVVSGHVPCARTYIDGIIVSGIKCGK